jgi:hypothetical protein
MIADDDYIKQRNGRTNERTNERTKPHHTSKVR